MKTTHILALAGCLTALAATSSAQTTTTPAPAAPPAAAPAAGRGPAAPALPTLTEVRAPTYPAAKPVWPTQTRAPIRNANVAYKVDTFASGLTNPWGLALLPNGKMIVTERAGRIRVIDASGKLSEPLTGAPAIVTQRASAAAALAGASVPPVLVERLAGMFDVALDPAFSRNRRVYWSYNGVVEGGSTLTVARGVLKADESGFDQVTVIFQAKPIATRWGDMGGRLLFDPKGMLFISSGDESNNPVGAAQALDNTLGKILRITTDGKPAPGNPKIPGALPEIYAYGMRDPEGLAFDAKGRLWVEEHGPRGGDEVNLVLPGRFYGWPVSAYGMGDNGQPVGTGATVMPGMEQPVYYWDPSIGGSALTFYDGKMFPAWKGNLLAGALAQKFVGRLTLKNDKVVDEERLFTEVNERFRMIRVAKDGSLYLLTDNPQGRILHVTAK